ncbi:putative E3 ubiquitin-protein ligase ARI1 [Dendrobium catenatum]|uniref:Putative E3 ubiquitin-protein ligase ARI1 n=1 Tax=Dendrobium catenatum TaxID=906689 RepID=A0A2I0VBM1_9ASPA|nr:putative E3 ubiquitin-protein ligase ARI1 [Dendrobium catenatum]
MELLVLSEQHARTLLIHYRWDVERIFELLEEKGKDRLFSEAGLTMSDNKVIVLSSYSDPFTCSICFEDVS